MRQQFLDGVEPTECVECWKDEDNDNSSSDRIMANKRHKVLFSSKNNIPKYLKILKKDNLDYPEDIDIMTTNLCNLKCQMCRGKSSSKLLIENNALGFENLKQKDYSLDPAIIEKYTNEIAKNHVRVITFAGGEPFIDPNVLRFIKVLSQRTELHKELTLEITTNGTTCNNKLLDMLKKFKHVQLIFSVESTDAVNEYLRFPSKWETVEKNIGEFLTLPNATYQLTSTVQNLNILYLARIIDFAFERDIHLKLQILSKPDYLRLTNLPKEILIKSLDHLINVPRKKLIHTDNFDAIVTMLKLHIRNYKSNDKKLAEVKSMIKKRDEYRNIQIKDYLPELANDLNI